MVVAGKNLPGKGQAEKPVKRKNPGKPVQDESLDELEPNIEDQLTRANATRVHAETARQKISTKIMDATMRLFQTLVEEGEQTLEQARKREAEAELNLLESQRELQHSQSISLEADSYRQKVIAQTKGQCQEMLQQAQTIKSDAVAFRDNLLFGVKQQASEKLDFAQTSRIEADSYRERIFAQTQRQAEGTLTHARLIAEQERTELIQKYAIGAHKVLAQAELIKAPRRGAI